MPPAAGGTPQTRLYSAGLGAKARPWCQANPQHDDDDVFYLFSYLFLQKQKIGPKRSARHGARRPGTAQPRRPDAAQPTTNVFHTTFSRGNSAGKASEAFVRGFASFQLSTRPRAWAGPAGPARNTEESVVGHFCGRESNCQILCRSLELLVWCFQTQSTSFFVFFCGVKSSVRKKNLAAEKSRVICATDNGVSTRILNGAI